MSALDQHITHYPGKVFYMTTNQTATKTCAVKGCDNPRHVTSGGRIQTRCIEHLRLDSVKHDLARGRKRNAPQVCGHPGCTSPRDVSKNGKVYAYCKTHRQEYNRNYNRRWMAEHKSAATEAAAPVVVTTPTQQDAGFTRNAVKAAAKLANQQVVKLLLIDYDSDQELYIEGKVILRSKTHRDQLKPGGYELLLESHADLDYIIAERGTPESAPGTASRYDWMD